MLAKTYTCTLLGIDATLVEVEVDISRGLPSFATVGLPDNVVRESKDRVKAALHNSGYSFPPDRITVNLAPAHLRKEGAGFDLPLAVGILAATGMVDAQAAQELILAGELSLDGRIKPLTGTLPMALQAQQAGFTKLLLPTVNAPEAAVVDHLTVLPAGHLSEVVEFLNGRRDLTPVHRDPNALLACSTTLELDFNEVKGQEFAKRGLEIAAAGGHNVLLVGPPGSGKTMLAQRLPSILPPLTFEESLETSKIYSVAGLLADKPLITSRPFRAPHHTISDAGLVGGGRIPRPGEVSLAQHGVLFLDEFPEFRRSNLDLLRQPLEDGFVTIARASATLTYPARFMLVAAMNPCPCGFAGDLRRSCSCSSHQIQRYRSKISGPILDRIDLHIEVPAVAFEQLTSPIPPESSAAIRDRTIRARDRQVERFHLDSIYSNSLMQPRHIKQYCGLDDTSQSPLKEALRTLGLTARSYNRILKVSRTIADLEGEDAIAPHHVLEAIQFRTLDRQLF